MLIPDESLDRPQIKNEVIPSEVVTLHNGIIVKTESKERVRCDEITDEITIDSPVVADAAEKVHLIHKIIDTDNVIKNSYKNLRNFRTEEENGNPRLSSHVNNEKNSLEKVKSKLPVELNSDIHSENAANVKNGNRKFTCSRCSVTVNSRTALTFHYNAKHLNNNNSAAIFKHEVTSDSSTEMVVFSVIITTAYDSNSKLILLVQNKISFLVTKNLRVDIYFTVASKVGMVDKQ